MVGVDEVPQYCKTSARNLSVTSGCIAMKYVTHDSAEAVYINSRDESLCHRNINITLTVSRDANSMLMSWSRMRMGSAGL